MRLALLLGGVLLVAFSAMVVVRSGRNGVAATAPQPDVEVSGEDKEHGAGGLRLRGWIEPAGIEPGMLEVRCTPLALGVSPAVVRVAVTAGGAFDLGGLEDSDYLVELVTRGEPVVVLASRAHVRPGCDELVLTADPLAVAQLRHPLRSRD